MLPENLYSYSAPTMKLVTAEIQPIPAIAIKNPRHATVEHIEDYETLPETFIPKPVSRTSTFSSGVGSPTSTTTPEMTEDEGEGEVEDIVEIEPPAPLCRRDGAHEIATSLWGLVPPKNFARVMPGIYRSSFPKPENLAFLKTLGLKTILTLVPEPYPAGHARFVEENGIQQFQIGIEPNKDPFVTITQCNMSAALGVVLNRANHPLLIHCNKGKHRTGCVVGCLRKIMGWELARIFAEYRHYASLKARVLDERYIELFDERAMLWLARLNYFIPADEPISDSPIMSPQVISSTRLRG